MLNKIKHRGPDQEKIFKNGMGSFGFVRLKIIDISDNSNQPFVSENKKIQIIYNGEIYNYKLLRKKYFPNKKFKSNGDGEILLYLYEKYGIEFVNKIKGMFAICIIDENKKKLFLIRDRFGIKPLYYHYDTFNKKIYFCSEIKGINEIKNINTEVNKAEAYKFFHQGLINSGRETWFKNIFQVKPSHYIEYSKNKIIENKYYSIENYIDEEEDYKGLSFKHYINNFKEKIQTSFKEHNQFDVKAGIHLSGGVDSAVLAAISCFNKKKYNSYTFDFENKKYSEIEYARSIAKSTNLQSYSSILKEKDLPEYLLKVIDREYEPFSSLRILSQHHLYDTYKNDCKVILDGNGGDEIGAGYSYQMIPWYLDLQKNNRSIKNKKRFIKFVDLIKNNTLNINQFIKGSFSYFKNPGSATIDGSFYKNNKLFSNNFMSEEFKLEMKKPFKSYLRNSQYRDLYYLKLQRSLRYADRASMYNSIEARVPFLDHEVVECAFQIPSKFKLLNGQQRIINKYPYRNFVNKKNLYLNKRTIADPQSAWLKGSLKNMFQDIVNSASFNEHGFFNKNEVNTYFNNFLKHKEHFNSFLLFQILISEIWYKRILKSTRS
tara:strand:- start:1552 stop:3357 length:1806 start_codon:yes stop_codon:yes gene_type:complete